MNQEVIKNNEPDDDAYVNWLCIGCHEYHREGIHGPDTTDEQDSELEASHTQLLNQYEQFQDDQECDELTFKRCDCCGDNTIGDRYRYSGFK